MQTVHHDLRAAAAKLQPIGQLPDTASLNLVIGLPLRNKEALTNLILQLNDPASPNFRHYLRPDKFVTEFGPTEGDYQAVIAFARANGLTVTGTHANRTLLEVRGTVAAIKRAFHVNLGVYRHPTELRSFYCPDAAPSLELAVPLLAIGGLDNYRIPRPISLVPASIYAGQASSASVRPDASSNTTVQNNFRAAYVPGVSLDGTGQAVGLLEFDGYYSNDISSYESQIGMLKDVAVTNVLLEGFDGVPDGDALAVTEVSLDIEMAITMAPRLSQVIVYEGKPNGDGNTILNRMATDDLAKQLSSSWNFGIDSSTEQIFLQFAAQGQSFFAASGDTGAYAGGIPSPDDDPYITIVGGTSLTSSNSNGTWVSETAWNSGGGGTSSTYPIPYWQQAVNMTSNSGSTAARNIPDVAMAADNIYVVYNNGQTGNLSGTSFAAPLWAGFMALVNQQAVANGAPTAGFINPALCAIGKGSNYAICLHDIITGNNTNASSPGRFYAVPGYDLCTGWGTPAGSNLITALATPEPLQINPASGFSASGPGGGPFSLTSLSLVLTNIGPAPFSWRLGSSAGWLTVSQSNGTLIPDDGADTVTVSFNPATSNLVAGSYSAALWFTNEQDGFAQYRQFSLTVWPSLIQNGGLETGDFSGWTESGNSASTLIGTGPLYAHSGGYGAQVGPFGSLGYLSQNVPTTAGQSYLLSFWLDSPDGRIPNEFLVSWNGTILFDRTNLPAINWTNLQYIVQATRAGAVIQFGFRDDPSFLGLDDISLLPVSAPVFQSVTKTGDTVALNWKAFAGLHYQLQYTTNLSQTLWTDSGPPVTATNSMAEAFDPAASGTQRFYRVLVLP